MYYVCDDFVKDVTFEPALPKGLTVIDGIIKGIPEGYFDRFRIKIKSGENVGFFYISGRVGLGWFMRSKR